MDEQLSLYEFRLYDWCASCNRHETALARDVYKYCLECGHIWPTAQGLVEAYNFAAQPLNAAETAEDVHFCPLCLHDF